MISDNIMQTIKPTDFKFKRPTNIVPDKRKNDL